jgi:hypothetical protein
MNDELERIWKEEVVANGGGEYPGICMEGMRNAVNISVGTAGVPAEIRTKYHKNTFLERYR